MKKILEIVLDALFVVSILPFAIRAAWLASREEAHDARIKAMDGGDA